MATFSRSHDDSVERGYTVYCRAAVSVLSLLMVGVTLQAADSAETKPFQGSRTTDPKYCAVIRSTIGSLPRSPCAQSVVPAVTTVPPRV